MAWHVLLEAIWTIKLLMLVFSIVRENLGIGGDERKVECCSNFELMLKSFLSGQP
jgi:hypothetical protein